MGRSLRSRAGWVAARAVWLLTCMDVGYLGGHNEVALSLNGKTPLASATSAGKGRAPAGVFSGELALDLSSEPKAQGVREFWVHLILANGSGKATNVSNRLTRLVITGGLARGPH